MDFQKNKKMIFLAAGTILICLVLIIISGIIKKRQALSRPEPKKEATSLMSEWDMYDKDQAPLSEHGDGELKALIDEEDADTLNIESLDIYPAPSYVSDKEDTLIYKKGIYKRIGFVKEKPVQNDTIYVEGKAYVQVKPQTNDHIKGLPKRTD